MTEQEKQWFDALTKDRSDSARTLEKPSMRGVQRSVVDKYSDQAHFIYELLQNADDAKATTARFVLKQDGLVFTHNGTVRFSISNPAAEADDSENGMLGHMNAITSIANSNKTEAPSIGKFGVGFKAVFQYTKTPHIYDPDFHFKVERFIVPYKLDVDFEGKEADETVFWFPFDHEQKQPEDCRFEIAEKLKALVFPTLFLSQLASVSWDMDGETGKYSKTIKRTLTSKGLTTQRISLVSELGAETTKQDLWLFSRSTERGLPYCIGYAIARGTLKPISTPAFCFFPTKETTNLNFIIHAPFLLTDSREGIKAGEKHNHEMIQKLAQLAADSLPVLRDEQLIDDGILDIIPYDEARFSSLSDRSWTSFKPFYTAIKEKLQADSLLPAANSEYSSKDQAYWASDTELVELFGDKQLAQLTGTKDAHWVFRGLGRKEVLNAKKNALAEYIDGGNARAWIKPNLIISSLDPEAMLKTITADFIGAQSQKWLHGFYAYLAERASYQRFVKGKPIFLDQDGNAVSAFDDNDQLILFLPDDDIDGYTTIKKELLSDKATRRFVENFGVKKPSLHDEIYNKILPEYDTHEEIDTTPHFKKFFHYFKECRHEEIDQFIRLISDKDFLEYKASNDDTIYRGKASSIYLPTDDLRRWFETKPDARFLQLGDYREMVGEKDYGKLDEFLRELKVLTSPQIICVHLDYAKRQQMGLQPKGNSGNTYADKVLDGLDELFASFDKSRSPMVWQVLANSTHLGREMDGVHEYHVPYARYNTTEQFESSAIRSLRTQKWILNQAGELVSAKEATVQSLSEEYDTTSAGALSLIRFLDIRDDSRDSAHLSDEEKRKIRLAEEIEQSGLSEEEVRAAIGDAKRKKNATTPAGEGGTSAATGPAAEGPVFHDIRERIDAKKDEPDESDESDDKGTDQGAPSNPADGNNGEATPKTEANGDADDYTPRPVDYGKKIDRAKDRHVSEIGRLEREQELLDKANSLVKYSYGWFLALLELECMASNEKNADSKTISISFGKVERDKQSSRTIVLKEPSRFIPQSIEELSGVRLDLDFGDGRTRSLRIESLTAKEFSLLGKLESAGDLSGIDLNGVLQARIDVKNPSFLLHELLERLRELNYDERFDMKGSLTSDIEFVFGPPGTGKTTHLAEKVLIPRMIGADKARVLVLAPTNKAADVLTNRIMEKMGGDTSYLNWLIRFGTSADERIERAGVWRDRSFDIGALSRSLTVTTIARFAYDGFAGEYGKKLHEMTWDAIVFDEASMISLASIIYPLYRQKSPRFIIAGDPFQIEPIVAVEQWKDENIYTLVGLNKAGSFAAPATGPHDYPITNLETQYRSIPAIGEVFSRFTYNGILKHHRGAGDQRPLRLNGFDVRPLNLIKFPVSKFESIYRAKRLESGTPYQTYSALFTFELVRWLAGQVQGDHAHRFRIGVIAPYRAQANLLNKLNDSWAIKPDSVQIQVGTIHGFQGDECDIIVAVFNPPPTISTDSRMFLNKQNILNVAISRARDYLFIVVPDDETEGVENLHKIAKIEELVRATDAFSEYESRSIEEMIWGNANYLEENTFSTGHQMVNVYRKPERYYEVRSDDSAIDVQIHVQQHIDR